MQRLANRTLAFLANPSTCDADGQRVAVEYFVPTTLTPHLHVKRSNATVLPSAIRFFARLRSVAAGVDIAVIISPGSFF